MKLCGTATTCQLASRPPGLTPTPAPLSVVKSGFVAETEKVWLSPKFFEAAAGCEEMIGGGAGVAVGVAVEVLVAVAVAVAVPVAVAVFVAVGVFVSVAVGVVIAVGVGVGRIGSTTLQTLNPLAVAPYAVAPLTATPYTSESARPLPLLVWFVQLVPLLIEMLNPRNVPA